MIGRKKRQSRVAITGIPTKLTDRLDIRSFLILVCALSGCAIKETDTSFYRVHEPIGQDIALLEDAQGHKSIIKVGPSPEEKSRQCIEAARALIQTLTPYAQEIVKRPLQVDLPDKVTLSWGDGRVNRDLAIAMWTRQSAGAGSISIFPSFCLLSERYQRVVIAHELGHAIDNSVMGNRRGHEFNLGAIRSSWTERPQEIVATSWALEIYRRGDIAIGDVRDFFANYGQAYWNMVQNRH